MLEKQIEKKVHEYAKSKHILSYKFTSPQRRSVPDRLFISPAGQVFFIEFKAPGKKPTDAQWREITRLRHCCVPVLVVDDVDHGKRIMDAVCIGLNPRGVE